MKEYESYDGLGLAELVRKGETQPKELLDAALERMERHEPTLNAVPIPMILEARAALDAGLPEGPFTGVPFLLKDLHLNWAGVRTTNGSQLFTDHVPDHDSELTERYRAAGLVTFGKSLSPEFGITPTSESIQFGDTRNPWNTEHSAGGSSGGSAAATAAGYLPLANASDGGGSIRIPAAACGLFGMKPTRGRMPMGPDVGEGWAGMSIVHAVSRSVRDSAALLDATAGPDLGAPYVAPPPVRSYLEEVTRPPSRLRIALQRSTWNGTSTHADCVAAVEDAARLCEELGHDVVEAALEIDADAMRRASMTILPANLLVALEDRAEALGRELVESDVEAGTWGMATAGRARSAVDYVRAVKGIHHIGRQVARFQTDYDVILTPTMALPPTPLGTLSLSNPNPGANLEALLQTIGYCQIFNASGSPAMSVPLAWNDAGLPIGIQFAGRFGDEGTLFRLAGQLEQARPWFNRRPPLAR
ncbi:MAG: amidase [bacterium]|nr:amidase [bacterium]